MRKNPKSKLPKSFGGHSLEHWDRRWIRLEGGFTVRHRKLAGAVGLYRAVLGNTIMFIGCSTALDRRLQQLRSEKELRSNSYYSARQIRKHIREAHLEVLLFERPERNLSVNKLKTTLVREHRPEWNWHRPSERRIRK